MNIKKSGNEASVNASSLVEKYKPPSPSETDLPPFSLYKPCQQNHAEGYIEFPIGHAVIRVFQHNTLPLSYRQRIVLGYAIQGKSDKAIAKELNLSPVTIKQHMIAIRRHLKAVSRSELCFRSILFGLIEIIPLDAEEKRDDITRRGKSHEMHAVPIPPQKPDWGL